MSTRRGDGIVATDIDTDAAGDDRRVDRSRSRPAAAVLPGEGTNLAVVRGVLTRDADERTLPSGERVLSYDLRVSPDGTPGETVPVAWVAPDRWAPTSAGAEVVAVGRVRRRFFRTGGRTQARTEVAADRVLSIRRRATIAAVIGEALDALDDA